MIVLEPIYHWDPDPYASGYHSGSIGSEVERAPETAARRPIGFRFEKKAEPPEDPSWMLL